MITNEVCGQTVVEAVDVDSDYYSLKLFQNMLDVLGVSYNCTTESIHRTVKKQLSFNKKQINNRLDEFKKLGLIK